MAVVFDKTIGLKKKTVDKNLPLGGANGDRNMYSIFGTLKSRCSINFRVIKLSVGWASKKRADQVKVMFQILEV